MCINDEEEENFNNFIQIKNNENYNIKLILPNDFDGDCNNMFNNISVIKKSNLKILIFVKICIQCFINVHHYNQ